MVISHIIRTFVPMKTKKREQENLSAAQLDEQVMRNKVGNYLVCFLDQCPLHDQCLRWIVGQYVDTMPFAQTAINPRNPKVGGAHCAMFRKKQRVLMKRGFKNLYLDMPGRMEYHIRHHLIQIWGRKKYFEMRRGDRLITPEQQQDVIDVCRHHGWKGPIVYDGEQEDWLW